MKEFNFSFLGELKNEEFPEFFYQLYSILEVESVEDINVKECLEEVISHQDELEFVMKMRNPHPLTEVLGDYTEERKTYLVSLRGKIFSSLKSPIEAERKAAKVLAAWMNKHTKGKLYRASITTHSNMVRTMMKDLSLYSNIQDAVGVLSLTPTIDSIVSISQEIDEAFTERSEEQSADVRKALSIRRAAYKSLKKHLKAVEVALSVEKPEEHFYRDYSRRIDNILDFYRVKYLARKTRNKNAAEKAEMEDQEAQPENGAQNGGTTESMGGKPAMAGGKGKFGAMALNGMDLHNGTTSESVEGKRAMSENGTNGVALDGSNARGIDPTAGNGGLVIEDLQDDTETGYEEGAIDGDDYDHES